MLRIAFVVHSFQAGGLERCVARLASRLDRARFLPVIICLARSGSAERWIEVNDVVLHELNKKAGNDFNLIYQLARLLHKASIDVVHSHNWGSLVESVIARMLSRVPYHVHAERGLELHEMNQIVRHRKVREIVERISLSTPDAIVAVSNEIQSRLNALGVRKNRVHFIPNGIDQLPVKDPVNERMRIRRFLGIGDSAILVCSVCRFTPVKDLSTAVRSIAIASKKAANLHLVLVGAGPELDVIHALAREAGIANKIHLVGEQTDVGPWLTAADIYLNSSLYEGMSQAVLEAMASGLPLVVTDVGENRNLVGGEAPCGFVLPVRQIQQIANAISVLADDKELRLYLGQRARQRQREKYSQDCMIRRYEDLYGMFEQTSMKGIVRAMSRRY